MNSANQAGSLKIGPALKALALRECRSLEHSLAVKKTHHERIHDIRKSSRRLRSVLTVFKPVSKQRAMALDKELKRLLHSFSALRDAHVAVLTARSMATTHETLTPALLSALEHRSATLLDEALEEDSDWHRRRTKVRRIVKAIETLPWQLVTPSLAKHAVQKSFRRVKKARRAAFEQRTVTTLHRWRRRARKLRYQLEFLCKARHMAGMKKKRTAQYGVFIKHLKSITDRLGWRQDFHVFLNALDHLPPSHDAAVLRQSLQMRSARLSKALPSTW
jgi:CHAD domain-containing protein